MMSKQGKIITVTSSKGGVGKTIFLLNLAGILSKLNQKVLLVDCDFTGGAIALNLDLNTDKNIFHVYDDVVNRRYKDYQTYITPYNKDIDVIGATKDPRQALKIEASYIMSFLKQVKNNYDIILVDTTNGLNKDNVTIIDESDLVLYLLTNDLMDMKNTKLFMNLMNEIEMDRIKIVLNNSRDPGLNYFSQYDIRSMIGRNIDYSLGRSLYIKNITSFILEGQIFTLNKTLTFKDKKDLYKLEKLAQDLIDSK